VGSRAIQGRDDVWPAGIYRFTYDGEPMDGYSELSHGRASVTGPVTLRAANAKRRSITLRVSSGTLTLGGSGVATTTGFDLASGSTITLDRSADAAIYADASSATVEFVEELVKA